MNLRFQRIHQSLGRADPVSPASSPLPPAQARSTAAPGRPPLACPRAPGLGLISSRRAAVCQQRAATKTALFFHLRTGFHYSFLQRSASGRAVSRVKSKLSHSDWGKSTGAASWSRNWKGSQGTAFYREDAKSRRGRALSKVTRLAERT